MTPHTSIAHRGTSRTHPFVSCAALPFGNKSVLTQQWEGVYGGSCSVEDGRFRVIPVLNGCCDTVWVSDTIICPIDTVVSPIDTTICPVDTIVFPTITVFCGSDTLSWGADTVFCGGDTTFCGGDTTYSGGDTVFAKTDQAVCTPDSLGYIAVDAAVLPDVVVLFGI